MIVINTLSVFLTHNPVFRLGLSVNEKEIRLDQIKYAYVNYVGAV